MKKLGLRYFWVSGLSETNRSFLWSCEDQYNGILALLHLSREMTIYIVLELLWSLWGQSSIINMRLIISAIMVYQSGPIHNSAKEFPREDRGNKWEKATSGTRQVRGKTERMLNNKAYNYSFPLQASWSLLSPRYPTAFVHSSFPARQEWNPSQTSFPCLH